jgi:polar amino acid transport system substrate-binding protein
MTRIAAFSRLHHTSRRTFLHAVMAASAVVALLPGRPAHADVLANIQKAGVIRVAIPNDFPPFGSLGPDLKLQGYDIDMANLVAKELGVKAELVPVTSTNRIPFLTTGKVDIVISSLGKNAERAKVIDFTQAYAPFPKSVYGPNDQEAGGPGRQDHRRDARLDGRPGPLGRGAGLGHHQAL